MRALHLRRASWRGSIFFFFLDAFLAGFLVCTEDLAGFLGFLEATLFRLGVTLSRVMICGDKRKSMSDQDGNQHHNNNSNNNYNNNNSNNRSNYYCINYSSTTCSTPTIQLKAIVMKMSVEVEGRSTGTTD